MNKEITSALLLAKMQEFIDENSLRDMDDLNYHFRDLYKEGNEYQFVNFVAELCEIAGWKE